MFRKITICLLVPACIFSGCSRATSSNTQHPESEVSSTTSGSATAEASSAESTVEAASSTAEETTAISETTAITETSAPAESFTTADETTPATETTAPAESFTTADETAPAAETTAPAERFTTADETTPVAETTPGQDISSIKMQGYLSTLFMGDDTSYTNSSGMEILYTSTSAYFTFAIDNVLWGGNVYHDTGRSKTLNDLFSDNEDYKQLTADKNVHKVDFIKSSSDTPLSQGENDAGLSGEGYVYEFSRTSRIYADLVTADGKVYFFSGQKVGDTSLISTLERSIAGAELTGKGLDNNELKYHYEGRTADEIIKNLITSFSLIESEDLEHYEPFITSHTDGYEISFCEPVDAGHESIRTAIIIIDDGTVKHYYLALSTVY